MHATFSSTVAGWQGFYALAGAASASLVGLIFVAVSLHLDLLGESGMGAIFTLARRTFTSFILIVIIALVFLVPKQEPAGLGWPLLFLGVGEVLQSLLEHRSVVEELRNTFGWQNIANRVVLPIVLPVVSGIGLILVAATVLAGSADYLYWMVPIIVLILANAALNAWTLMLGLGRHKATRSAGGESGSGV